MKMKNDTVRVQVATINLDTLARNGYTIDQSSEGVIEIWREGKVDDQVADIMAQTFNRFERETEIPLNAVEAALEQVSITLNQETLKLTIFK